MRRYLKALSLIFLLITAVVLIPLQMEILGWTLWALTIVLLLCCEKEYRRDLILVVLSLGIVGITQINTNISYSHIFQMSALLIVAVAIPFLITRKLYKEKTIRFPFHHGRNWYKSEIFYIFLTAIIAYLLLPFYLQNTGAYHNWTVKSGFGNLFTLFMGTNALGIWDELFFISTVLAIFKKHFSFGTANAAQAVLFTSFLFELGFRGWIPLVLYPFALTQGYIFKKTDSLLYVITIHLTLDWVLFLALIHAYYPSWLPIFLT
jgi:CAAX prenyl protease-like protein